jgi:hypothetical protein
MSVDLFGLFLSRVVLIVDDDDYCFLFVKGKYAKILYADQEYWGDLVESLVLCDVFPLLLRLPEDWDISDCDIDAVALQEAVNSRTLDLTGLKQVVFSESSGIDWISVAELTNESFC